MPPRLAMGGGLVGALLLTALPGPGVAQTSTSPIVPGNRPDQRAPAPAPPGGGLQPTPARQPAPPTVSPFQLSTVVVQGSSLSPELLAAAWRPFVGRTIGQAELVSLSDAFVRAYERSNLALYTILIPAQDFAQGQIRVRVVEGHVEAASIEGPRPERNRALVASYLSKLTAERPLTRSSLQRYVSLIRDIPGLTATLQFQDGGAEGAVKLAVKLDPDPLQVGLAYNNRGTAFLGRSQLTADVYLNSSLRQGDQTRFTVAAPTQWDQFQYYAVSHSQIVGSEGTAVQVNAGYLRTRPSLAGVTGHADSIGATLSHPLVRSYSQNLFLTLSLDGLDSHSAFLGQRYSDDRTRVVRTALAYTYETDRRRLELRGAGSLGIDGLGARTITPQLSDLSFHKLNLRAAASTRVAKTWVLRVTSAAQLTGDRLPAAEQFALGGSEFGRAYEAAVVAGDYGYAVAGELAFQVPGLPTLVRGAETYVYADTGKVWYRGRAGFAAEAARLSSTGVGVRIPLSNRVVVQVEGAKALPNRIASLDKEDWRGVFAVRTLW